MESLDFGPRSTNHPCNSKMAGGRWRASDARRGTPDLPASRKVNNNINTTFYFTVHICCKPNTLSSTLVLGS